MAGIVGVVAVLLVLIALVWRFRVVRRHHGRSGGGQAVAPGLPWEDPYRSPTPGGPVATAPRFELPDEAAVVEIEREHRPNGR